MKTILEYLNNSMITEKYITLFEPSDMEKYAQQIYDMTVKAYEYIGGLAGCTSFEDFKKQYIDCAKTDKLMWKCVKRNGDKITAFRIYTLKRGGRKSTVMASDGTEQGKKDLASIMIEDFRMKDREAWSEQSGKALTTSLKLGKCIIPNVVTKELMKDKFDKNEIKLLDDGYFYLRKIKGEWHCKTIVGNPPNSDTKFLTDDDIQKFKNMAIEYSNKYDNKQ